MVSKFLTAKSVMGIAFEDIVFMRWLSMAH